MEAIYLIDIERGGRRVGSGPITSAISWESEVRLGEVGDFKCKIAATDTQILHVQPYSMLICRAYIQTVGYVEIGRGEVRDIKTTIDPDGKPIVEASGPDNLNRLTEKSVGYLEIGIVKKDVDGSSTDVGNPIPLIAALGMVKAEFDRLETQPGTFAWNFDYTGITDLTTTISYQFAGETILAALTKLCELAEVHFVVEAKNIVKFRKNSDFPDCGTRAIAAPANPDPLVEGTCYIAGTPTISEETRETFTRIIPWGYGRAEGSVGLHLLVDADPSSLKKNPADWGTLPSGYAWVLDADPLRPGWPIGISHVKAETDSSAGYPGRVIEKFKKYQDVEAVYPDDIDGMKDDGTTPVYSDAEKKAIRARANRSAVQTLLETALRDLDEALNRTVHYDLSLLHLDHVVRPGQKIHCVFHYRLGTGWTRVDQWLNITGVRIVVDSQGVRTSDLTVSTVARPPRLDADPLLQLYAWLNRFGA